MAHTDLAVLKAEADLLPIVQLFTQLGQAHTERVQTNSHLAAALTHTMLV